MRDRPFSHANEAPRPFSEICAERRGIDPHTRAIAKALDEVAALEGAASEASDPAERKHLQCQAEEIRVSIDEQQRRFG